MIKNIRHKALRNYWFKGQPRGLNTDWVSKISRILRALEKAETPEEMNLPGYYFHQMTSTSPQRYSVRVSGNYRITFSWSDQGATDIDLEDYH